MFSHSKQTILRFNFNSCQTAHTPNWVARKNNNNTEKNNARIHGHWLMCVCGSQPIHCQFRLFVCVRFDLFCFSFIGVEWDKHTTQLNMSDPFQLTTIPFESLFCPWTLNAHCVCVCVYFKDLRKTKTLRISLCIAVSRIRFTVISTMNSTNAYVFLKKMFDAIKNWQSLHILFVS